MKVWVVTYNNRQPAVFFGSHKAEEFIAEEDRLGYIDPDEDTIEISDTSFYVDDWISGNLVEVGSL